jgi:hypothetical protein
VNYSGDKPIEAIQIDVTPHPATLNSSLSVNISSAMSGQSITMQIIDMLGRVVADHTQSFVNLGVWTLPLSGFDLRPGTYIVVVRVGNSTTSQPIIVTEGAQ